MTIEEIKKHALERASYHSISAISAMEELKESYLSAAYRIERMLSKLENLDPEMVSLAVEKAIEEDSNFGVTGGRARKLRFELKQLEPEVEILKRLEYK